MAVCSPRHPSRVRTVTPPVLLNRRPLLMRLHCALQPKKPFHREKHHSCMVLSVDDDPINQMVVDNLLTPEHYTVGGMFHTRTRAHASIGRIRGACVTACVPSPVKNVPPLGA